MDAAYRVALHSMPGFSNAGFDVSLLACDDPAKSVRDPKRLKASSKPIAPDDESSMSDDR